MNNKRLIKVNPGIFSQYCALQGSVAKPTFAESNKTRREMNIDNAKSQMRKGMLEYCIMLLLRHRASYASDIITELKAAELIVVEGTLYPLLTRLKKDGLLSYQWQESTQGPPRKYYTLTPEGESTLNELDQAWQEIAHTVDVLKNLTSIETQKND